MPVVPSISLSLASLPEIVQCGLCVHGTRVVESFVQRELWSLHVYHYIGSVSVNGTGYGFGPGWASLLPPGYEGTWEFPAHAPHYYAHFRIPDRAQAGIRLPMLRDLGRDSDRFTKALDEMVGFFVTNRLRAHVRLWDLLLAYADGGEAHEDAAPLPPAVQIALSIIRNAGTERPCVAIIARQMGVSHNHLTRLFNRHLGCGVREFIVRERTGRAEQLLVETRLPMKSIAFECGFGNIQQLNKAIRAATGTTPTDLRAKGSLRDHPNPRTDT